MPDYLAPYNIVWDTPSRNAGESMPCGGHDIGLNVWVEADEAGNGDLLFYLDRAGSFDENNQMLKLGRVRRAPHSQPFYAGCTVSPGTQAAPGLRRDHGRRAGRCGSRFGST